MNHHEIQICIRGFGWAVLFLFPLMMATICGGEAERGTGKNFEAFLTAFVAQVVLVFALIGSIRP